MKVAELRDVFLEFFAQNSHTVVPSASLIPQDDPSLLFTNAGMVPFKNVFLGYQNMPYSRATSVQRCLRAGGKHNDLDNVGYTARHHTLFEMLGNFSFADYSKKQAIEYAWQFITQVLKLPPEKLWITVYKEDHEAAQIWLKHIGIDSNKFSYCGKEDNFWSMGNTGPCGPCTEIFYDHGPAYQGAPPGMGGDGERYVEVWNLVFMQYNQESNGNLVELPALSIDTGMGLERIAAVMQGVHNNYDIDLFKGLIVDLANRLHLDNLQQPGLRVVADHLRASSFLIADGVLPSNEGRGYVLRRIMRRAIRHLHKWQAPLDFLAMSVPSLLVQQADPLLVSKSSIIQEVLLNEAEQFHRTLHQGLKLFTSVLDNTKAGDLLDGQMVFKMHDTYGFPVDLTIDLAKENGFAVDMDAYRRAMDMQVELSRKNSAFVSLDVILDNLAASEFCGYQYTKREAKVLQIWVDNSLQNKLVAGQHGILVLNKTPFYAQGGGQVGDTGEISCGNVLFKVLDTQSMGNAYLHHGVLLTGELLVEQDVVAAIDIHKRQAISCNHSATHLLHAALRAYLGSHVEQKGSVVDSTRLRFDFSHNSALTFADLQAIELIINRQIMQNYAVKTELLSIDEAQSQGAMALFSEKYHDVVRVLTIGQGVSIELCGGTHVQQSGEIGIFCIVQEEAVAAGVRRIEALTGEAALAYLQQQQQTKVELLGIFNTNANDLVARAKYFVQKSKDQEKKIAVLEQRLAQDYYQRLRAQVQALPHCSYLIYEVVDIEIDPKILRAWVELLKEEVDNLVVVLAYVDLFNKVNLIAGASKKIAKHYPAGELIKLLSSYVDGRGGGRAEIAQAGGNAPEHLSTALAAVLPWIESKGS